MKIDKELLTSCVVNPWSIVPRMMLVDSMIESGFEEFKALESFEPPTISRHLPLTYGARIDCGNGSGRGNGSGYGSGEFDGHSLGNCGDGDGSGRIIFNGHGRGRCHGYRLKQQ